MVVSGQLAAPIFAAVAQCYRIAVIADTQSPVCRWQVVGNMVHVSVNASITGIASLTGIATLTGVPYDPPEIIPLSCSSACANSLRLGRSAIATKSHTKRVADVLPPA